MHDLQTLRGDPINYEVHVCTRTWSSAHHMIFAVWLSRTRSGFHIYIRMPRMLQGTGLASFYALRSSVQTTRLSRLACRVWPLRRPDRHRHGSGSPASRACRPNLVWEAAALRATPPVRCTQQEPLQVSLADQPHHDATTTSNCCFSVTAVSSDACPQVNQEGKQSACPCAVCSVLQQVPSLPITPNFSLPLSHPL